MRTEKKLELKRKRHAHVRRRVVGSALRPRMSVAFTNQHIYVQFIDDKAGVTIASVCTRPAPTNPMVKGAANKVGAELIGRLAAEAALAKGVTEVVFDRGGNRFHWTAAKGGSGKPVYGKLATLAQAARSAGLKF